MRIAKKISVKEVVGPVRTHLLKLVDKETGTIPNGVSVPLCTFIGKATGWQVKETDMGDSILLKGFFEGTSLIADKEGKFNKVRGGQCYLPGSAAEMVSGMFDDKVQGIEFAFRISIVSDDTAITGYVYNVDSLIEPQEDDALGRLAAQLPKALPPAGQPAGAPASPPETDVAQAAGAPVGKSEPAAGPEKVAEKAAEKVVEKAPDVAKSSDVQTAKGTQAAKGGANTAQAKAPQHGGAKRR